MVVICSSLYTRSRGCGVPQIPTRTLRFFHWRIVNLPDLRLWSSSCNQLITFLQCLISLTNSFGTSFGAASFLALLRAYRSINTAAEYTRQFRSHKDSFHLTPITLPHTYPRPRAIWDLACNPYKTLGFLLELKSPSRHFVTFL